VTNNEKLKGLMKKHRLGRRDVARLASYTIAPNGQCYAVNNWLAPEDATGYRKLSDATLALIELRLAALTDKERQALEGPLDKVAVIAVNRTKRACEQPGYVRADGSKVTRRKSA
jgi:hypothetical protein